MPVTEDFRFRGLFDELGRLLVDRAVLIRLDRAALVHGLAHDVEDPAERGVAHRNGDGRVGIRDDLPAHEAFGGVHRDGAHGALAQVLRHLENEALAVVVAFQRV